MPTLISKKYSIIITLLLLSIYLSPLLMDVVYFKAFDNLDSSVVWAKILVESGKLFADSTDTIPNMMNGLPREVYGSEFHFIIWLFYFLPPETAYRVNAVLVHLGAFVSMWIFLSRYIMNSGEYRFFLISCVSLIFAILPFHLPTGLSIAGIPIFTYILLNIKLNREKWYEWVALLLLLTYTDFVFMMAFYIAFAIIYLLYDTVTQRKINLKLSLAILLMLIVSLLIEYRLLIGLFVESNFISHRTEFDIFFKQSFMGAYRITLINFFEGNLQHSMTRMLPILMPVTISSILIALSGRRFNPFESIVIVSIIAISGLLDFWSDTFVSTRYTFAIMTILSVLLIRKSPHNRTLGLLMIFQMLLSIYFGLAHYEGLSILKDIFPILNIVSISRATYIQPIIWSVMLIYVFNIYIYQIRFTPTLIAIVVILQLYSSMGIRNFDSVQRDNLFSFEQYYAPSLFVQIESTLPAVKNLHFISYAIEPAVAQYHGLYTVDGYATNYPLSYKKLFRKTQVECLNLMSSSAMIYDQWGSKLYLLCADSQPENYAAYKILSITSFPLHANIDAICALDTDYLISGVQIKQDDNDTTLSLVSTFTQDESLWDIWLYKIVCER